MGRKKLLFVDLDGVVINSDQSLTNFMNYFFRIRTKPQDYISRAHELHTILKEKSRNKIDLDREHMYELLTLHYHSSAKFHADIHLLPGADKVIPEIVKKYELHITTNRPDRALPVIQQVLAKRNLYIENINCMHEYLGNRKFNSTKKTDFITSMLEERGVRAAGFVDDSTKEIIEMHEDVPKYLFDQYGNYIDFKGNHIHVDGWEKLGQILL